MDRVDILRTYGLFDAKVPRYTSYPPANRFQPDLGRLRQPDWLQAITENEAVSIYVHIPFCRRLCWFCACRTQGTKTLKPVHDYLTHLLAEMAAVRALVPASIKMARLHLGGGTPTLLSADQMRILLDAIFGAFRTADDFEFSVEIDPTEAEKDVLAELGNWGKCRASIGVQDFDPAVQKAIGRQQSFEETSRVVSILRNSGVRSLNIDLLYGLPFQTIDGLMTTLDQVITLRPDRLALYGYAHVPHMSKRQVMIPDNALPDPETRYHMSSKAEARAVARGYVPLGLDHFARPSDSLAQAAGAGTMRRNFQGYTDDPCQTLIGFGASAISTFKEGYTQNAVSTAAYQQRVQEGGLAAHRGYELTERDRVLSEIINALMCRGQVDALETTRRHPDYELDVASILQGLANAFPRAVDLGGTVFSIRPGYSCLSRVMAAHVDADMQSGQIHSLAI